MPCRRDSKKAGDRPAFMQCNMRPGTGSPQPNHPYSEPYRCICVAPASSATVLAKAAGTTAALRLRAARAANIRFFRLFIGILHLLVGRDVRLRWKHRWAQARRIKCCTAAKELCVRRVDYRDRVGLAGWNDLAGRDSPSAGNFLPCADRCRRCSQMRLGAFLQAANLPHFCSLQCRSTLTSRW